MEELEHSTRAYLDGKPYAPKVLPHPYAFNLFSHNTAIDPATGYNDEETKVIKETKKIFEDDRIAVGVTCVRVPVLRAHCVSMTFECEKPITEDEVRAILGDAPGVRIVDDRVNNYFPMPSDASGQDDVLVGRIRRDLSDPSGHSIAMFVAADQLLKGAALNAVQIAEYLNLRCFRNPGARRLSRARIAGDDNLCYFAFGFAQSAKAGKFDSASLALALNFSNCITFSMRAARNSSVGFSSSLVSLNQRMAVEP